MMNNAMSSIKKTKERIMRFVFLFLLQLNYVSGQGIRSCTKVGNRKSIENAIKNEKSNIILLCPFNLSNFNPIDIKRPNISIVCFKEQKSDKCLINNNKRHFNILADRVTLIGFDFHNSKSAAVTVAGKSVSFIDCTFKE